MEKQATGPSLTYDQLVQRNYGVYSRSQQEQIRAARIAVVGVGCDGGMAAAILARVGVGNLTLIDFDVVEACNLNRQPLCYVSNLGQKKVEAAKPILLDCNPFVSVSTVDCRITEKSIRELDGHSVILQCVDNIAGRVGLHRAARKLGIPVVTMTGQPPYRALVSTFLPNGPGYEETMSLPSAGKPLDAQMERRLNDLKFERGKNGAAHGATPGWADDYVRGNAGWGGEPVGWGITPERSYITATIQAHEALRIVTGRPVLAAAPRAIIIDLLTGPNLVQVKDPLDGKDWDYRQF
jgi:molybdopterin/thiamine biosynthesis adenylyltransferase